MAIVFRDKESHLRQELLTQEAENWAGKFYPEDRRNQLNSAQLRNFYNEVKSLEAKVKADKDGFNKNKAVFAMLKAKVSYACPNQGTKKVPIAFKDFIYTCVDSVKTEQDFQDFVLFFEAVVAFFYGKAGRK